MAALVSYASSDEEAEAEEEYEEQQLQPQPQPQLKTAEVRAADFWCRSNLGSRSPINHRHPMR